MTSIQFKNDQMVFVNHCTIYVCNMKSNKVQILENKSIMPSVAQATQKTQEAGSLKILTSRFSRSGRYFAFCDDYKQLVLYKTGQTWEYVNTWIVVKRCLAVAYTADEDEILVADKCGDVYSFSIKCVNAGSEAHSTFEKTATKTPLMGHLSSVLDMVFTKSPNYLITCDRNEKIRIGRYPNLYNIHEFCLGHLEYVVRLLYLESSNVLLSTGGDNTLRCWKVETGEGLACHPLTKGDQPLQEKTVDCLDVVRSTIAYCCLNDIIAVSRRDSKSVDILQLVIGESAQFKPIQVIQMSHDVVDITFDDNGKIWVLRQAPDEPFVVYSLQKDDLLYTVDKSHTHNVEFVKFVKTSLKEYPTDVFDSNFNPAKRWESSNNESGGRTELKRKCEDETNEQTAKIAK